jgi:hypothetical protein
MARAIRKMQTCRVCNTVECVNAELCGECMSLVHTLLCMRDSGSRQMNKKKAGVTVEKMLQRINTHWYFARLARNVRQNIERIGRFDYRRNKHDNDYVRHLYHTLTGMSQIQVC